MAKLTDKTKIKSMKLKNRLIRSATHEAMADKDGNPSKELFSLYEKLIKGGISLIMTSFAAVSENGRISKEKILCINKDSQIPAMKKLVDFVHKKGASIAMQIAHAGRQTYPQIIGEQPIAPSAVRDRLTLVKPREMTEKEIRGIIDDFTQAARRVKESGFDAVQIHAAHGYLLSSFLCPHTNRRKDKWGGSLDGRMRIIKEIYTQTRKIVGSNYPIMIKISAYDMMKNGVTQEQGLEIAKKIAKMGFDAIEISNGIGEDGITTLRGDVPVDVMLNTVKAFENKPLLKILVKLFKGFLVKEYPYYHAYNREIAVKIKKAVDIPVILVGGLSDPAIVNEVITNGEVDYVAFCRPLIIDPSFPGKLLKGSNKNSACIHCNLCLFYIQADYPLKCYHGKPVKA